MKTLKELKHESAGFLAEYREQQRKHQEAIPASVQTNIKQYSL